MKARAREREFYALSGYEIGKFAESSLIKIFLSHYASDGRAIIARLTRNNFSGKSWNIMPRFKREFFEQYSVDCSVKEREKKKGGILDDDLLEKREKK